MPEERKPENEQVDQELADYTDKVLEDGQAPIMTRLVWAALWSNFGP